MNKRPISPFSPRISRAGSPPRPDTALPRSDDFRRKLYARGDADPESFDAEADAIASVIRDRGAEEV
jgi:hypothetical protein